MRISNRGKVLLVGACLLAGAAGWAQQSQKLVQKSTVSTDLAITFAGERAQALPGQTSFWFRGGGADAAVTFKSGLGIAASLTGDRASNYTPGANTNKITYLIGPRYTWTAWRGNALAWTDHRLQIFGQGLFGLTYGFNGIYPATPDIQLQLQLQRQLVGHAGRRRSQLLLQQELRPTRAGSRLRADSAAQRRLQYPERPAPLRWLYLAFRVRATPPPVKKRSARSVK
jgi:hypothetical protein